MSVYLYVDGENHFLRSEMAFRKGRGDELKLSDLKGCVAPDKADGTEYVSSVAYDANGKWFWTNQLLLGFCGDEWFRRNVKRKFYFTSVATGYEGVDALRLQIRESDFEPVVIKEIKQLAKQRQAAFTNDYVIERAKGVDIEMAARILEDAYLNNFSQCILFTSDVDFLPVIKAIRRMGKYVILAAYEEGLGEKPELRWVPDEFWPLSQWMDKVKNVKIAR